jgi:hypothetical protein
LIAFSSFSEEEQDVVVVGVSAGKKRHPVDACGGEVMCDGEVSTGKKQQLSEKGMFLCCYVDF